MRHASFEQVLMEKSESVKYVTRAEELLSAMRNQVKPEKKRSYTILLQTILVACGAILAIAAAGKGFLYLDNGINTVQSAVGSTHKELSALKAQVSVADAREQLATVTAEMKNLRATHTQLQTEVEQIREALETSKAKKNNIVSAQRKR
jgi:hypothetical protein